MTEIIDGKGLAKKIRENLKKDVDELKKEGIKPKFAVILVGDDPASKIYVRNKNKACNEIGIEYEEHLLPENTTMEELLALIDELNNDIISFNIFWIKFCELFELSFIILFKSLLEILETVAELG